MASRDPFSGQVPQSYGRSDLMPRPPGPANLADILERVLDKGIVIAGDIKVNLLDIELLTIKIRLLVASVDRAKEMGINWWESDPTLTQGAEQLARDNELLRARLDSLEQRLELNEGPASSEATTSQEISEEPRQAAGKRRGAAASPKAKARERTSERPGPW